MVFTPALTLSVFVAPSSLAPLGGVGAAAVSPALGLADEDATVEDSGAVSTWTPTASVRVRVLGALSVWLIAGAVGSLDGMELAGWAVVDVADGLGTSTVWFRGGGSAQPVTAKSASTSEIRLLVAFTSMVLAMNKGGFQEHIDAAPSLLSVRQGRGERLLYHLGRRGARLCLNRLGVSQFSCLVLFRGQIASVVRRNGI